MWDVLASKPNGPEAASQTRKSLSADFQASEERVKTYIGRLKNLKDAVDVGADNEGKGASLDDLVQVQPQYRHIYFAGLPLEHSKEILTLKRQLKQHKNKIDSLQAENEKLVAQAQEHAARLASNNRKFHVAIAKAMQIGMACGLLNASIVNAKRNKTKWALGKLKANVPANVATRGALVFLCKRIKSMLAKRLKENVWQLLKQDITPKKSACNINNVKSQESPVRKQGTLESTVLDRLEELLVEEMRLLNMQGVN